MAKRSVVILLTTTTTTTMTPLEQDRYRFGGVRYQFQGTPTHGPDWIVNEIPGLYDFPVEGKKNS